MISCSELAHLAEDLRVLVADAAGRVDPVEDLVEAGGAEQDLDQVGAAVLIQLDEPGLERSLGGAEVRARDLQALLVELLRGDDPVELDLRRVVRLDDELEVRVELLDLGENLPGFGLLRLDGWSRGRRPRQRKNRQREKHKKEGVSCV